MNCPNCSKVVTAKDTFCKHCGAKIEAENSSSNDFGNTQLAPDFVNNVNATNTFANKFSDLSNSIVKKTGEWVNNTKVGTKALINKIKKSDDDSENNEIKDPIKLLMPAFIVIIALLLIIVALIFSGSSTDVTIKKMYYSAELEDEVHIFNKGKEIFKFDSEDISYYGIRDDGTLFVHEGDSSKDSTNKLYYAKLGKDDKLVKLENDITFYRYANETLAYVQYDDGDYTLYVGNVRKIDKAKEIASDVSKINVSEDGSTVYYTDFDNDVYVYKKGDAERVEKDAKVKYVKENGKEVILQSTGDDEEDRILYWVKNGESKEIAEDCEDVIISNVKNFSIAYLSDWDNEDSDGTLYYQKTFNSEPIEIEDNVEDFYLLYDETQYIENSHDYLFYEKKGDLFAYKIGSNKSPEKAVKDIEDYWVQRYDNLLIWLEDEEIMYYDLVKNEMNKFDIDEDVTYFEYLDGVIIYKNDDEEKFIFKSNESTLLTDEETINFGFASSNKLFKLESDEENYNENELYFTDSKQTDDITIAENINDISNPVYSSGSREVYVLADWDADDSEGTLYYYRYGNKKAIELLDDVIDISSTNYVVK